MALASRS